MDADSTGREAVDDFHHSSDLFGVLLSGTGLHSRVQIQGPGGHLLHRLTNTVFAQSSGQKQVDGPLRPSGPGSNQPALRSRRTPRDAGRRSGSRVPGRPSTVRKSPASWGAKALITRRGSNCRQKAGDSSPWSWIRWRPQNPAMVRISSSG